VDVGSAAGFEGYRLSSHERGAGWAHPRQCDEDQSR
jgi:hypothetical protein